MVSLNQFTKVTGGVQVQRNTSPNRMVLLKEDEGSVGRVTLRGTLIMPTCRRHANILIPVTSKRPFLQRKRGKIA